MIRAILACDADWGIGKNGTLPWPNNSADLKWFKETTMGGVVVMGKTTWDSLPDNRKPLPGRNNIVVTSLIKDKDGPYHFITFDNAATHIQSMSKLQPVWIIGGAKLVESMIDIVDEIWLSHVDGVYDCDTFLPKDLIIEHFIGITDQVNDKLTITKWVRRKHEKLSRLTTENT